MDIAILIPCYQEELTIGKVVADFRRELPKAKIYVYDNNSTDATYAKARKAGAIVCREKKQGKGYVVASMFENIDADIYVLVDGDDTYDAQSVHQLIAPLKNEEADMVVANRLGNHRGSGFRKFHVFGNRLVCFFINMIFRSSIKDLFSGYRAMTKELVKTIPVIAFGFDIETELTLQTLYRRFVIKEIDAPYGERPSGSESKLRTVHDGIRVLVRAFFIFTSYKPLTFFGSIGIILCILGLLAGYQPVMEYIRYHYVFSVPRAVLATAFMILSSGAVALGLLLHSVNFRLLEIEKALIKRTLNSSKSRSKRSGN